MYVSFDAGDRWQPLQLHLPVTSLRDVAINGNDLLAATTGRSLRVHDDMSPLRQASAQVADEPVHLFTPQPATRIHAAGTYTVPTGAVGANGPDGAVINYFVGAPGQAVDLEITDSAGRTAFS